MVVVRKTICVKRGQLTLQPEVRYHYYITNQTDLSPEEVVEHTHQRCRQERLIEQLKNGPHALTAPLGDLRSNWAYMVIVSLAWTMKAWMALCLPQHAVAAHRDLLRMTFRRFVDGLIRVPARIARTGRRLLWTLLGAGRLQPRFLELVDALERPLHC